MKINNPSSSEPAPRSVFGIPAKAGMTKKSKRDSSERLF